MTLAALILALIATPAADVASPNPGVSASRGEPVLLDFHAAWCSPCKAMRPGLAQLASAGYPIRSIDVDQEKEIAARYGVTSYPTFIVVDESGNQLARTEGYQPASNLASLYKEAQAKTKVATKPRSRPAATPVSERTAEDDTTARDDAPEADEPATQKVVNPQPWETVVRIRIRLSAGSEGVGSGTIIYSDARQAIILTCAHIFKEDGRTPPPPSRFNLPIQVDLFDGQPGGPRRNQVHYLETIKGEAIDYDPLNDVGLIRIRPGRVLPSTRVVPPHWKPTEGMHMYTVGCSEGKDATAWDTTIVRPKAGLMVKGTDKTFHMIECDTAPKQGRSGGGLYTDDYYLAGVCDFADQQHNRGLYAVPQSIYRLLDRNKLTALYDPATRNPGDSERLLANAPAKPKRGSSEGTFRGQSTLDEELTMPTPKMLGIKPPVLAKQETPSGSPTGGDRQWHSPSNRPTRAIPARMSREGDTEPEPMPSTEAAAEPAPVETPDDLPAPKKSKWKPVKGAAS